MIQRIQTLWLLLAAVACFLTFRFSFYSGLKAGGAVNEITYLNATTNIMLTICAAATGIGALITIFFFKDRKTQLRIAIASLLISLISLVLYFSQVKNYNGGTFSLTAVLSILVPVFLFLAIQGIIKDQKLIKSLDRLR